MSRLHGSQSPTLGMRCSHTKEFVNDRRVHNDTVETLTNNLIIRLDRLIADFTEDAAERKDVERRTVPWIDDSTADSCSVCRSNFTFTRRKHHCRLCGKIICSHCSQFLSYISARKLTNPAFAADVLNGLAEEETKGRSSSITDLSSVSSSLDAVRKRTGRLLNSIIHDNKIVQAEPKESLRICAKCKDCLSRRENKMDLVSAPSVFMDLYEKLCTLITQVTNLAPSFCRMVSSLRSGESLYSLDSAIQLRKKLIYVQREITILSERIEQWGLDGDPAAQRRPTAREMIVQKNIRMLAISSLHNIVSELPEIPDEEEYRRLNREHKMRSEVDAQKEMTRRSNPSLSRTDSTSSETLERPRATLRTSASFSGLRQEDSWSPDPLDLPKKGIANNEESEEIHPIAQQYLIIKGYLKQAAESGRLEEVVMLEKNLVDLEEELNRMNIATPRIP